VIRQRRELASLIEEHQSDQQLREALQAVEAELEEREGDVEVLHEEQRVSQQKERWLQDATAERQEEIEQLTRLLEDFEAQDEEPHADIEHLREDLAGLNDENRQLRAEIEQRARVIEQLRQRGLRGRRRLLPRGRRVSR